MHQQFKPEIMTEIEIDRILLVVADDDPSVRESLKVVLEMKDFEVSVAGTAEEAITLCEEIRPAAVVIDYNLPETNGAEAARQIRLQNPAVAVIGISSEEGRREEMLEAGASDFMAKPVNVEELIGTIMELVGRAWERKGSRNKPL
jgi:DNA-binding response OmpR family regulator